MVLPLDRLEELNLYNIGTSAVGGDNLTRNPNREAIVANIKMGVNKSYEKMSPSVRKEKFGKSKELNSNWKGGISVSFCKCGNTKSITAHVCVLCLDKTGVRNPFYGKQHSQDTKYKLSIANKGKLPPNAIQVSVDGIIYPSASACARALDVTVATIGNRIKNTNMKNYKIHTT